MNNQPFDVKEFGLRLIEASAINEEIYQGVKDNVVIVSLCQVVDGKDTDLAIMAISRSCDKDQLIKNVLYIFNQEWELCADSMYLYYVDEDNHEDTIHNIIIDDKGSFLIQNEISTLSM